MEPVRQLSLFDLESTSSSEGSRNYVSHSASQGSKKARKTSGTSGLISHDSSEKSDPVGYWLRTYLASELSRLTSSSKTWRNQGTPLGRSWWVLMTSEPRTVAKGCGLSAGSDWPTPTAHESETRTFASGASTALKQWPTPEAADGSRGSLTHMRGNPTLKGAVMWPTATAGDAKASGSAAYSTESGRHAGTTLTDAASGLWASPQARDWKDSGPTQGNRKSPNLGTQAFAGLLAPESPSTHGKRQDWPTPRTTDATGEPDPTGSDGMRKQGTGPDLKAKVRDTMEWPTPRANRHGAPDSHGKRPIRGSLNPAWVTQLQGFPDGWLDSEPPAHPRTGGKR